MSPENASDPSPGRCQLSSDGGGALLRLSGDWQIEALRDLDAQLSAALAGDGSLAGLRIDGGGLRSLDTAASLVLVRRLHAAGVGALPELIDFDARLGRILNLVADRAGAAELTATLPSPGWLAWLGSHVVALVAMIGNHVGFLGLTIAAFARLLRAPARLRWRELSAQIAQTGLTAIPVISLVTFLIGLIVAYLLGLQAEQYGANIFVVDGVSLGMVREFSPLIVAVIVAGRSGAAFTAQLGTMKLTEEIDAIRTLGLSAEQVLIVPRVLALLLVLPLLVFVGDLASLAGAMFVSDLMLDITPTTFVDRLHETLAMRHFVIGLGKAPVFALVIAVIGCAMGMSVRRDTRAIGINTTSTVVQSIVAVILLDALFAVFFQELEL